MIDALAGASEGEQAAALRSARRRATGLLAAVAVAFVAASWLPDQPWVPWLRAALEAGLVGGLADWFAVVALFRHPLGIPIPHTAVIPKSKDGLGANLSTFVEENFLASEQLDERLADPTHVARLGGWLADPLHAERVATEAVRAAGHVLDAMDREAMVKRVSEILRARLAQVPVSRLAGERLESALREQRHRELVTAMLLGVRDSIAANRTSLRRRLGEQSPSWVPPLVDDLVFDRAEHVARNFLGQVAADPQHELRSALDKELLELTARMQADPDVMGKVDGAAIDAIDDLVLERLVGQWWDEVRARVERAGDVDGPATTLRTFAAGGIQQFGERLAGGTDVHDRAVLALAGVAPHLAEVARSEVGGLIESTIDRWDAQDTSRRLELWLGRDLQFVRINGTVVGALVGLLLHAAKLGLG